jgi:hypothetical protein
MYIKRLAENLVQKYLLVFEIYSKVLKFIVNQIATPHLPIWGVGEYGESVTPRLTNAGSRGGYIANKF